MALMGRPKIGDITRAQLRIKESKEFKVRQIIFICKKIQFSTFLLMLIIMKIHSHTFSIHRFHLLIQNIQNTVDKLVQRANASLLIGTSSWKEQFIDALTVSAGKRREKRIRIQKFN